MVITIRRQPDRTLDGGFFNVIEQMMDVAKSKPRQKWISPDFVTATIQPCEIHPETLTQGSSMNEWAIRFQSPTTRNRSFMTCDDLALCRSINSTLPVSQILHVRLRRHSHQPQLVQVSSSPSFATTSTTSHFSSSNKALMSGSV
jgi:hypothetical protein